MSLLGIIASGISGNLEPVNPVQTNLYAWFDASQAADFTYSSGTVVSQWNDRSGNARNWSQVTVANQPSRSGTMNGYSTVVFDANDMLAFSALQDLGTSYTLFAVLDVPAITATMSAAVFAEGVVTNGATIYWGPVTGGLTNERVSWLEAQGASGYGETATNISAGDHQFMWRLENKTTVQYRSDKTTRTLTTAGGGWNSTTWGQKFQNWNSTTFGMAFEIAEVILYDTNLSDADRDLVEDYLSDKWGV